MFGEFLLTHLTPKQFLHIVARPIITDMNIQPMVAKHGLTMIYIILIVPALVYMGFMAIQKILLLCLPTDQEGK